MQLNEFLYNKVPRRKIAISHFLYTKKILIIIAGVLIYYMFLKSGTKYDAIFYIAIGLYAFKLYIKTPMTYSDKLNIGSNQDRAVYIYKLIATMKKKNLKEKK